MNLEYTILMKSSFLSIFTLPKVYYLRLIKEPEESSKPKIKLYSIYLCEKYVLL